MKYFKSAGCYTLLYIFIYICLNVVCSIISPSTNISAILTYVSFILFTLIYLKICGDDIPTVLRLHKVPLSVIALTVVLAVASYPLVSFINSVSMLFFQNMVSTSISQSVSESSVLSLISIVLMPAFAEEIMFRGVLFSRLRAARPVKGIILSALVFGLAHLNVNQISYALVMGILFGFLVELTDSIFPSMLMHMLFNGVSVVFAIIAQHLPHSQNINSASSHVTISTVLPLFPFAVASFVLILWLLYSIAWRSGRLEYAKTWFKKDIRRSLPKDRVTNVSFYITVILLILLTLFIEFALSR